MSKVQATIDASKERVKRVGVDFKTFTVEADYPFASDLKAELQRLGPEGPQRVFDIYKQQCTIKVQALMRSKAEKALKDGKGTLPEGFQASLEKEVAEYKPTSSEGRTRKSSEEKATESFDKMSIEQQREWIAKKQAELAARA